MDILEKKPGTKRPVIVRAATLLFAERGIDATSMREIAQAAGVRDAAIYRHFVGKDDLAREIFMSWYGWHCRELQQIVSGPGGSLDKVRRIVQHEFAAVTDHGEAFVYFCKNEVRFMQSLPAGDRERPARAYHVHQGGAGSRRDTARKSRIARGHAERRVMRGRGNLASIGAAQKPERAVRRSGARLLALDRGSIGQGS